MPNSRAVQTEEEIDTTFLSLVHSIHNLIDIFATLPLDAGERYMGDADYPPETDEEYQHRVDFANERRYAVEAASQLHNALVDLYNENWADVRQYVEI